MAITSPCLFLLVFLPSTLAFLSITGSPKFLANYNGNRATEEGGRVNGALSATGMGLLIVVVMMMMMMTTP